MKSAKTAALAVFFGVATVFTTLSTAEALSGLNYVSVEPASLSFELSNDEKDKVAMLTIHNKYKTAIRMTAELKGIDETAGKIIPTGDPSEPITDTIKISETEFTIPAQTDHFLSIAAHDSGSLSAGGHYATLVLSEKSQGDQKNAIQPQLSVGIFLVKREGATSRVVLTRSELHRKWLGYPQSVDLEVLNDGNVHAVPRASVHVIDEGGNILSQGIFNQQSTILLPGTRLYQNVPLAGAKKWYLPKKLTLEIRYRADGMDNQTIYKQQIWYVPVVDRIAGGIVLALIILTVFMKRKSIARMITKKHTAKKTV